jgi:hypothetical protein
MKALIKALLFLGVTGICVGGVILLPMSKCIPGLKTLFTPSVILIIIGIVLLMLSTFFSSIVTSSKEVPIE